MLYWKKKKRGCPVKHTRIIHYYRGGKKKDRVPSKEFLSTADVAEIIGVSRIAIFKRIKSGTIHAERVGRSYVIRHRDLSTIRALGMSSYKNGNRNIE